MTFVENFNNTLCSWKLFYLPAPMFVWKFLLFPILFDCDGASMAMTSSITNASSCEKFLSLADSIWTSASSGGIDGFWYAGAIWYAT